MNSYTEEAAGLSDNFLRSQIGILQWKRHWPDSESAANEERIAAYQEEAARREAAGLFAPAAEAALANIRKAVQG